MIGIGIPRIATPDSTTRPRGRRPLWAMDKFQESGIHHHMQRRTVSPDGRPLHVWRCPWLPLPPSSLMTVLVRIQIRDTEWRLYCAEQPRTYVCSHVCSTEVGPPGILATGNVDLTVTMSTKHMTLQFVVCTTAENVRRKHFTHQIRGTPERTVWEERSSPLSDGVRKRPQVACSKAEEQSTTSHPDSQERYWQITWING